MGRTCRCEPYPTGIRMSLHLDCAMLITRRTELGLTQRALARILGVSSPTVARLEAGSGHADMTLRFVERLACALAVSPQALLAVDAAHRADSTRGDPAKLCALLADAGVLIRTTELATALGWELARVNRAVESLAAQLEGSGQQLHKLPGGQVSLRADPSVLSRHQREASLVASLSARGLSRPAAQLLHLLTEGPVPAAAGPGANKQVARAVLLKAGLAETVDGRLELTDAARFNLGLMHADAQRST